MKKRPAIDPVDAHVGQRLRLARALRGLSQEKLAAMEGLTFQQQQKYEKGLNRVSASRLYHLAEHLRLPVSWFFEGVSDTAGSNDRGSNLWAKYNPADKDIYCALSLLSAVEDHAKRKAIAAILQSALELLDKPASHVRTRSAEKEVTHDSLFA